MTLEIALAVIGMGLYAAASVAAVIKLLRSSSSTEKSTLLLLAGAMAAYIAILTLRAIHDRRLPAFGRFEALTLYALAVTGAYLQLAILHRMKGLSGIVVPYITALVILAFPGIKSPIHDAPVLHDVWLGAHVLLAFVGYAMFTLASFLAIAYLAQDNNLKKKRLGAVFERMPSLETLEHVICEQTGAAFAVFTAAIASGAVMVWSSGGGWKWMADPKIVASFVTWGVYGVLLFLETRADRHGRKLALATVVGLLCVLFAFFGVHLVAESLHGFAVGR